MTIAGDREGSLYSNSTAVRTEVRGFEIQLEGSNLVLSGDGTDLVPPIRLTTDDAERLRLEMAKAQLWEWNRAGRVAVASRAALPALSGIVAGAVPGCLQRLRRISQLLPLRISLPAGDLPVVAGGIRGTGG